MLSDIFLDLFLTIPYRSSMQPVWKGYKMSKEEMKEQLCWNFLVIYFCALAVVPF